MARYRTGRFVPKRDSGFTYLGLLFLIVLIGIVLSGTGVVWHTEARREKELQLLFVGDQYRKAIGAYYATEINGHKEYPPSLDELLEDHRFPMPVRHLRKRFFDPITNSQDWGLVKDGDRIVGIFSLSREAPLKRANFGPCCQDFADAKDYTEWKFVSRSAAKQDP